MVTFWFVLALVLIVSGVALASRSKKSKAQRPTSLKRIFARPLFQTIDEDGGENPVNPETDRWVFWKEGPSGRGRNQFGILRRIKGKRGYILTVKGKTVRRKLHLLKPFRFKPVHSVA